MDMTAVQLGCRVVCGVVQSTSDVREAGCCLCDVIVKCVVLVAELELL